VSKLKEATTLKVGRRPREVQTIKREEVKRIKREVIYEESEDDTSQTGRRGQRSKPNKKTTTKNVIKNLANQVNTYARKHSDLEQNFKDEAEKTKKKVSNISELNQLWYSGSEFSEKMRELSMKFMLMKYNRWVFNSQIMEKRYFLQMRRIFLRKCSLPPGEMLTCIID